MAGSIDIGSGVLRLPDGWVVLEDKRDCFVGEAGIQGGFRNSIGTVWILHTVLPPAQMQSFLKDTSEWKTVDNGKLSGFDYIIMVKPGKEQSPFMMFPQIRTYFQIILTDKGYTDATEMLRWWTPPHGKRFREALAQVKEIISTAYSPVNPDATKIK